MFILVFSPDSMATHESLFSETFLKERLAAFDLAGVVNISGIKRTIRNLNDSLSGGKLDYMKEESLKSRFLMELFGDVLGFNYKNVGQWLFQEEVKTEVDGTKPDGALGSFYITDNGIKKEVRVVIEVKDTLTDLDIPQQDRTQKIKPVDQAMLYATKMGESCRWVVVTNMREIRFYRAGDQTRYQRFLLQELTEEPRLRELLFLFLREQFYTGGESSTDGLIRLLKKEKYLQLPPAHLVDQIYFSLIKFDRQSFIDPNLIANMRPFNIMDKYVHHYADGHLFSLNPDLYRLLEAITISDGEIQVASIYEAELVAADVVDITKKVDYILKKLYNSHISLISALRAPKKETLRKKEAWGSDSRHIPQLNNNNSISLKITLRVAEQCECLSCTLHSLDFEKFIGKLERMEDSEEPNSLELAYGHYWLCTDNFKRAYQIYKQIEKRTKGDDQEALTYFYAKYNIKQLLNLFFDDEKYAPMRKDARGIDLDRVISDELDLFATRDMRKAMLEIKEDRLFEKAVKRSRELLAELKTVHAHVVRGGSYMSLPNYAQQLYRQFAQVFGQIQKDFLVFDKFTPYGEFMAMVFEGMVISSRTPKHGIKHVGLLVLTEALLHLKPKEFQRILKPVGKLKLNEEDKTEFLLRAKAFFGSYAKKGAFGDPYLNEQLERQLLNYRFKDKYTNIFSNLCLTLSVIETTQEEFAEVVPEIIRFMKVDGSLAWWDVVELGKLIERKGEMFRSDQLADLLKFALENHRLYKTNKYEDLIRRTCNAFRKYHPTFIFDNTHMAKRAILNCESENGHYDLRPLSGLWHIANDAVQHLLSEAFEAALDREFNDDLCELLIKTKVLAYDRKDYLAKLSEVTARQKGPGFIGFENGNPEFKDFYFYNFILIAYILDLEFSLPEFSSLKGLSQFETWLADPSAFNYENFDARWLLAANNTFILKRLSSIQYVKEKLAAFLKESYDKQLSRIYFKYFS